MIALNKCNNTKNLKNNRAKQKRTQKNLENNCTKYCISANNCINTAIKRFGK